MTFYNISNVDDVDADNFVEGLVKLHIDINVMEVTIIQRDVLNVDVFIVVDWRKS